MYFSDIQDFTSISEKLTAEDLVDHLEDYLTAMSEQISRDHGTIDKYIGDAVMAFWGALSQTRIMQSMHVELLWQTNTIYKNFAKSGETKASQNYGPA